MILVSSNLKIIRKNKGLTQREVAEQVNIRLANYIYIEQGKNEPRLKTALLIAKALDEPIDKIFFLKRGRYKKEVK
jgi:DNA-binding XRE family transcriptional regulator